MSKLDRKYDSFEEAIRNSIDGSEQSPSPQVWDRIATSLDVAPTTAPLIVALRWVGAIAASIVAVVAANILLNDDAQTQMYNSLIAEFRTLESAPIYIEPVMIAPSRPIFTAHTATAQSAKVNEVTDCEIVECFELEHNANESHHDSEQPQASHAIEPYEQHAYYENLIEEQSINLTSSKRPIHLSMMVSGGPTASSSFSPRAKPQMVDYIPSEMLDLFASPQSRAESTVSEKNTDINHHAPISTSLSVAYSFHDRWSVESGLVYTRLNSDISSATSEGESLRQSIDLLGIPLRVNYKIFSTSSISIYTGADGQIERCLSSKVDGRGVEEKPWHTSAGAVLGVQYNLNDWLGIYAEPEARYYFTTTDLTTIRTSHPLYFNFNCGLRFTFGKN